MLGAHESRAVKARVCLMVGRVDGLKPSVTCAAGHVRSRSERTSASRYPTSTNDGPSQHAARSRHGNGFPYFFRTAKKKAPSVSAKCLISLPNLVGANGLEPSTPTMSRWCSNQLSYAPEKPQII